MKGKEIDWKDRVIEITDGNNHHLEDLANRLANEVIVKIVEFDLGNDKYDYLRGVKVYVGDDLVYEGNSNPMLIVESVINKMGYIVKFEYGYEV